MQVIIFTDLDGSLLDHADYSYAAARPSLDRIKRSSIPFVITTSKTRREVEPLQKELGMREPFIIENGRGVFFPRRYRNLILDQGVPQGEYTLIRIGTTYSTVRRFVERVGARFGIRGFGDMSIAEIAR